MRRSLGPALLILGFFGAWVIPGMLPGSETVFAPAGLSNALENAGGSARSEAMGSAVLAVSDGSESAFENPAGLGNLKAFELGFHHNSWLMDINQETFVLGLPMQDVGGVAISGSYVGYGSIEGRDSLGNLTASYSSSRSGMGLSWGKEWFSGLSVGLSGRWLQQSITNKSYVSYEGDLGVEWAAFSGLTLGLSFNNFGASSGGDVASAIRVGADYALKTVGEGQVVLAAGASFETQGATGIELGLEYALYQTAYFRGGYQLQLADNALGGLTGLSAGIGFRFKDFRVDYAYLPYGDLGGSNRVSLNYQFGQQIAAQQTEAVQQPAMVAPKPVTAENQAALKVEFKMADDPLKSAQELESQGKLSEAIGAYQQVIKANPNNVQAWRSMGTLYYRLKSKAEAITCFEQVLRLNPQDLTLKEWLEKYKQP